MAHAMTVRLDDEMASDLATVATVRGMAVADAVRLAVGRLVDAEKADPEFRRALREHIGRAARLLGEDSS